MRYQIAPLFCRPWTPNGISARLIESHYENNYGGAVPEAMAATLVRDFDSVDRWRQEFITLASARADDSGWALLTYVPRRPADQPECHGPSPEGTTPGRRSKAP